MSAKKRPLPKPELYEAIAALNRNFEYVLTDLNTLARFGFRKDLLTAFEVKVEELRAWANSELIEMQHDRELRDWAHFGRRNRKWQRRYDGSDDILSPEQSIIASEAAKPKNKKPGRGISSATA